ncbi:MAG: hypothetical protein H6667_24065 [Ardenticatenaceae bacterium]|nr:hypothetical protein [Ardenticatenaceae bacterium]
MVRLRQVLTRFDKGFLVVLAICLLAVWPFLSRASLPQGTDAELHIFRLHELSYLVRNGAFFPRWAPNFYHGYGYPIFNYYAPLTYYLGLVVELLPRLDAVSGVKAVFVLGLLLGGLGMYGFVRDNWGRRAGYVATAVYVYAPYVQYIDPHARGVLPESFSLGLFPVALWALDRVRRGGGRWWWVTAVLATSGILLTHNLMGPLFFGVLLAWAVWQVASGERRENDSSPAQPCLPTLWHLFTALMLGLAIAAYFWLPVLVERNAVNLNTLIGSGDNYDFRTHFLSWRELLAPTLRLDWGATQPAFHFNLGVAQWILGALGLLMLALRRTRQSEHLMFFVLALAGLLFLMLPVSQFVWEAVPFLPYFQFPWRLLGSAAMMLAILAGAGVAGLMPDDRRTGTIATIVAVALPLILALPLTQPALWPDFGEVSTARMTGIEHRGRWLGTTSTSDYVPATVDQIPKRNDNVVAPMYENQPPDRVNWATLPDGAEVNVEVVTPLITRYHVLAPKNFRLRLFLFDFPGWQVRIDGQLAETELGRPEGFIVIPVPKGEHLVEVKFGTTPDRTLAWAITIAALLVMAGIAWKMPGRGADQVSGVRFADGPVLTAVLLITAVAIFILQPLNWLHYSSANFAAQPAETAVFANFGDQAALIGYTISQQTAGLGDEVGVDLYWQAERPLDINYQVFVHLLRTDGTLVAQSDKLNPGEFPTRQWPQDKYVLDHHQLHLPVDLPPGEYTIACGLWVQSEGWRLPLFDETGQQIGDHFVLSSLVVK